MDQNNKYAALDKAWKDFVNYDIIPKQNQKVWDKKLFAIEGNNVNLDSLHAFINGNFSVEECDKIYKKAKQFKEKSDKSKKKG